MKPVQALLKKCPSVPRNKLIAEIFYYAGMIEQWGGGTGTILSECASAGLPEPAFEQVQGFRVAFRKAGTPQVPPKYPPSTPQVDLRREILEFCAVPRTIREMLHRLV